MTPLTRDERLRRLKFRYDADVFARDVEVFFNTRANDLIQKYPDLKIRIKVDLKEGFKAKAIFIE